MYHFVKDISDSGNDFNNIVQVLLNTDQLDLLERVLDRGYPDDYKITRKYSSKVTMIMLRNYAGIKGSYSVEFDDYINLSYMDTSSLIGMIVNKNFTEASERIARAYINSIVQEDLTYLGPENSCYAEPFVQINGKYICLYNNWDKARRHEIKHVSMNVPDYMGFAKDITEKRCGHNNDRFYWYVSRGYDFNTGVMDGTYTMILGNNYNDRDFIEQMNCISACTKYAFALEKDMNILKDIFPDANCTAIDAPLSDEDWKKYYDENEQRQEIIFYVSSYSKVWAEYSYEGLEQMFVRPNNSFEELNTNRVYNDYEIDTEIALCLINVIYSGKTIWTNSGEDISDLFEYYFKDRPEDLIKIYKMINRIKFNSFKINAFYDISIVY